VIGHQAPPNRSVFTAAASCPIATRALATASANPVGPQTYTAGLRSGGRVSAASVSGVTRPGFDGQFGGVEVYHFEGHTEKPELKAAEKYLASGDYLWHGNYYMWTPRLFLNALKK